MPKQGTIYIIIKSTWKILRLVWGFIQKRHKELAHRGSVRDDGNKISLCSGYKLNFGHSDIQLNAQRFFLSPQYEAISISSHSC